MKPSISLFFLLLSFRLSAQQTPAQQYWNYNTQLTPWRLPLAVDGSKIQRIDLDNDGAPDIIKSFINDSIPIMWIDDDDDMKSTDVEGDTDSDCLLIDRNRDGVYAGPGDLSIDWNDEDKDGIADIQLVVQSGKPGKRNFFDWDSDFMYIIDFGKKDIKHFIDWNLIRLMAWEHNGHANFFEGYQGNTLFLKMHASSFRIDDVRYSWENPFIFYDTDKDGLSEWTIRMLDQPHFRPKVGKNELFDKVNEQVDAIYSKKISWVGASWDLDNDNGQSNEFDYDMSLRFSGPGFDYSNEVHQFKSLRGLPAANKFFYDARWRQIDELIYTDQTKAWNRVFNKASWNACWFVFDEDDDCNRWERVEFYDPRDPFKKGGEKGGLDDNLQADELGDRGEWDMDFSGKGQLYVSPMDGRIHLFGAEFGYWRIDQTAYSFQGFGGLYGSWEGGRIQLSKDKFATVKYTDANHNGFVDQLEYDLDGDSIFETKMSLVDLQINDSVHVLDPAKMRYKDFNQLFIGVAKAMWEKSQQAVVVARRNGLNPDWYSFWMQPRTIWQKYEYGYWLNFYIYKDLRQQADLNNDPARILQIDKAYYSGNWRVML